MRLLLINPNTSQATTAAMVGIARDTVPGIEIDGLSAPFGVPLITGPTALEIGRQAVNALIAARPPFGYRGLIVAAFGDPGVADLRQSVAIPVTGIAEAGMAEAAAHGPFAVVTTTPDLVGAIAERADLYGHGDLFLGTVLTDGDVHQVMGNREGLSEALREACQRAVKEMGARALVIGGGPLAVAARAIAGSLTVPIIEPVPAAVRLAVLRASGGG
jgi:Asp/Glu/hydantoin racemase